MEEIPRTCREFLGFWGFRDLSGLAHSPYELVSSLDEATQQVLYAGVHELLDNLVDASTAQPLEGLATYMNPEPGEEARWQLAALTCDTLVLRKPHWEQRGYLSDQPVLSYCTNPQAGDFAHVDTSWRTKASVDPGATTPDDHRARLDRLLDELDRAWELEMDQWRSAFPRLLASYLAQHLRFVANLGAVGASARVRLVDPDLSSSRDIIESLKDYVELRGRLTHSRDIAGELPTQARYFSDVIENLGNVLSQLGSGWHVVTDEVLGSYAAGESFAVDRLPLVPSSRGATVAAAAFFARFNKLGVVTSGVTMAEAQAGKPWRETNWQPALLDKLVVSAFPNVRQAPVEIFRSLSDSPRLEQFRSRLRTDARWIAAGTAEEKTTRLHEIQTELRNGAIAAARAVQEQVEAGRMQAMRAALGGAVGMGIGFVTAGPLAVLAGGLIGGSIASAIEHASLDPTAPLSGSELALMTFDAL